VPIPTAKELPALITLLADPLRWQIVTELTFGDERVSDLASQLEQAESTITAQLETMRTGGLVGIRQSDADPAILYYQLDQQRLRELYQAVGLALNMPVGQDAGVAEPSSTGTASRTRVLFLCTANSARSQLAEGLMRTLSKDQVDVSSAGTMPASQIHPLALQELTERKIDTSSLRPKSIEQFVGQKFDYVISVCDQAHETCPDFPGAREIHWSIPDPALVEPDAARQRAFHMTAVELTNRVQYMLIMINRAQREADVQEVSR
jgi:protein-tyrosine-phosphatase/DNA-binding HxlR family transcriptional regulator